MIPLLDMQAGTNELSEQLQDVYSRFLSSGRYVLGPEVGAFEDEYADYCGADCCVGVSSGLDALHLALRAAGVEHGAEVIVASNTYIATWLAVTHAGGRVVPVEPDPATHNIDPADIQAAITGRTRAILATNLYGLPVDYDRIRDIADEAGVAFLVDNAQAGGAAYKGRPVGGIADIECHSFYPTKNLGALGEAGRGPSRHRTGSTLTASDSSATTDHAGDITTRPRALTIAWTSYRPAFCVSNCGALTNGISGGGPSPRCTRISSPAVPISFCLSNPHGRRPYGTCTSSASPLGIR